MIYRGTLALFTTILLSTISDAKLSYDPQCHYDIDTIWTKEVGSSAFAATPLIYDVNMDGVLDIIGATFTEEITVVDGKTGQPIPATNWPFSLQDNSFHASPLQYDYNKDGQLDICICTSNADIVFFENDGTLMYGETIKIPNLAVERYWYKENLSIDYRRIGDVIFQNTVPQELYPEWQTNPKEDPLWTRYYGDSLSGLINNGQHVSIDAHILSTPVIADLNNDGTVEEMVISVSYFFDTEFYSSPENLEKLQLSTEELDYYIVSGIVIFNLTSKQLVKQIPLALTKASSEHAAYALFSPTLVDLDSEGGPLEIIVGILSGQLFVINNEGSIRPGFPKVFGPIHGQVLVEDLNNDGKLEIVVTDSSVNVMCLDSNGDLLWDASLPGVSTAGSRVADINDDQILDVVIATNIGYVVAFRGDTGEVLPNWPKTLGNKVLSNVLISRIKNKEGPLDILVPTYDGSLHVISGDGRCSDVVWLGEQSLVQLLAADLHKETPALELLVSTMDGTLMCLHTSTNKSMTDLATVTSTLHEWTAETNTHNSFTFWDSKVGVEISESTRQLVHVTGMSFVIEFTILDEHKAKTAWNYYHIKFLIGSIFLHSENFSMPGQYMVTIPCPHKPVKSSVQVEMRNQHGQVFTDSFPVSLNMEIQNDVQWLLLFPFVTMTCLLLLLHGYPTVHLLPMSQQTKKK